MLSSKRSSRPVLLIALVLVASISLISATKSSWTKRDKAFFADADTLAFVRPGLKITIQSVDAAADGVVRARVSFTDEQDVPLDRNGVFTPGAIVARWTLAYIPAGEGQYTAYTTNSIGQAANDSGGVWEQHEIGDYTYTFGTRLPSSFDMTATHTVSVSASRNLSEWDLGTNLTEVTHDWVPDGSPVTVTRDVVRTETCNVCHDRLALHGTTGRTTIEGCVMCHQPQSIDPESGNTVDMKVMIHKIHFGADLPSVQAGNPYFIVGFGGSVHDYSDVVYPADARRCGTCHTDAAGAAQHEVWLTNPTRVSCGSCHDDVNFATGENHAGLPQPSDNQCKNCHTPEGELEFDLSIVGGHTIPEASKELPGTVVELQQVFDHGRGQNPRVAFKLTDKSGNPLVASEIDRLQLALDGPTTDFSMDPIIEDAQSAAGGTNGEYIYTFEETIPMDAAGSWAVSVEARQAITLLPGTVKAMSVRDSAMNPAIYFSVDGSPVMPRREVVSREKCNDCHADLALHGNNRKSIEYCVMCHHPNADDSPVRPADQMPAESIDFRTMVHRIHTGKELSRVQAGEPYIIFGFRGSVNDFSHVGYPGMRSNCSGCHINDSQQLPLAMTHIDVQDPRGFLNPVGPESAACLSCHDSLQAASHALANTSALGESCAVCHGPGKQSSVDRVHAQTF